MSIFKRIKTIKLKDIESGHLKTTYKGIPILKSPFDYVIYQMLILELKPDLIIEIGTYKGGSAIYYADLLDINGNGEVHTIDINYKNINPLAILHPRIKIFTDGYINYDLTLLNKYNKILIIEDGSHTYEDTLKTLEIFHSYVTPGSYFIVEDGIITDLGYEDKYNGGPQKAIAEFLSTNSNFIIDNNWCDFFGKNNTFNINGYLKRVS